MEDWRKYRISDLTIMKNGKKRPSSTGPFPVYGGNGIMDYADIHNAENTIIVGRVGAYCGNVYRCPEKCWVSDNAIAVFANDLIDIKYLYYLMSSLDLHHMHIGGAQPLMTQDIIGGFEVFVPSLEIQKEIISIISSLDDKIELNRRINDNLERQAQALFKAWFVDFEPFKDGKFVDSELGRIPEGWKVTELGNVTKQITERVSQRTNIKVLSPITTGELVLSEDYFTKQVFSESTAKYIVVKPMQFAYNPARVNIGSMGMNTFPFNGCVSPVYVVFECENEYQYFFDYLRKTKSFKEEVISRAIGGVRQSLGYKDFALIKVIYPPKQVVDKFNEHYLSLLRLKGFNEEENKKLSSLRDTLLPRLMSGELKIDDLNR